MKRCILLAGGPAADYDRVPLEVGPKDCVIACDAGYAAAGRLGFRVDLAVGDFDSYAGKIARSVEVHRTRPEKNETDTILGARLGLDRGYREFVILGGFGGRLDHTVANLQTLHYLRKRGARGEIRANENRALLAEAERVEVARIPGWYLSVFAWSGPCKGVTLEGVKYPLCEANLRGSFPLGVSNEFAGERAAVTVREGALLILLSAGAPE